MPSVAAGYTHRDKICAPGEATAISGARLKWYDIGAPDEAVAGDIQTLARRYLEREQPAIDGDLGFVVLHRCGDGSFYFLLLQTWTGDNEVWKTTFYKDRTLTDFALFPLDEPHKGAFCVWEMGAVWHEVGAWKRYLRSPRDEAAKQAYLADLYAGVV